MFHAIVVTPEELIATMDHYAAAGADEIMLQWFGVDDIEGLELLVEHVLPQTELRGGWLCRLPNTHSCLHRI